MISTNEIRVGSTFMFEGSPFIVQKKLGQKGGRQGITVNLRVMNIKTKGTQDLGIDAGEKFQEVELDEKTVKLSYIDGNDYHFMDAEYNEILLTKDDLGDNANYLKPSEEEGDSDDFELQVTYYEGEPVSVVLPTKVIRTVTYCEPGVKGDTSGKSLKPATIDTGAEVRVPLFINTGDRIVIDTREGEFSERAKDK